MRNVFFVLLLVYTVSCTPNPIDLGDKIDLKRFKGDRGGCNGSRTEMKVNLEHVKDSLLSHSENEVISTLGRYDFQILDRKNEKIFIYYLESGPQCKHIQNESSARSMAIHLNSVSLVKEVTFQNKIPG